MDGFLAANALSALAGPLADASLDELVALALNDREQLMRRLKDLGISQLGKRHALACALLRQASSFGAASETAAGSEAAACDAPPSNERSTAVPLVTRPPGARSPPDTARGPRCALLLFGLP